jgi:hypothetical protein
MYSGRSVALTTHPHLVPRSKKEWSYPSTPTLDLRGLLLGELYLYLYLCLYLYVDIESIIVENFFLVIPLHLQICQHLSFVPYRSSSSAAMPHTFHQFAMFTLICTQISSKSIVVLLLQRHYFTWQLIPTLPSENLAWRQAAQRSPLFQFAVSRIHPVCSIYCRSYHVFTHAIGRWQLTHYTAPRAHASHLISTLFIARRN